MHIRLLIALFGAPLAWIAQMTTGNIISSYSCYPHRTPLSSPLWEGTNIWLTVINVLCIMLGIIAYFMAHSAWQNTREKTHHSGKKTMEMGVGRKHFLSTLSLMSSAFFVTAIIFTSCAPALVSPC